MESFFGCLEAFTSCKKSTIYSHSKTQKVLLAVNLTLLTLAAASSLLWLGWWRAIEENDRLNLLEYAYGVTGVWAEWCQILFALSAATFLYFLAFFVAITLLVHIPLMRGKSVSLKMHFLYLILHGVVLLFCLAFMVAIQFLYSQGWSLLKLRIIYSAPVFHLVLIALFTILVGFLIQRVIASFVFQQDGKDVSAIALLSTGLSILALLISYVLPFILAGHLDWMPCIRDSVSTKPLLMAHRGAVGLAPENTKMAFNSAVASGSYGLESDLQVSKDGDFFMFHDKTLKRTTNIATMYPNLKNKLMRDIPSENVRALNAGEWYVERDPCQSVAKASESQIAEMKRQRVPSFRDYLTIAHEKDQTVIWDFNHVELMPPMVLQRALDVIDEVGIEPSHVWLTSNLPWFSSLSNFEKNDKNFRWTFMDYGQPEIDDLQYYLKWNISHRNVGYSRVFPTKITLLLAERNITSNVWVVSSKWMFSLFWCTGGVSSVTTNIVEVLNALTRPSGMIGPSTYYTIAGVTVALSVIVLSVWVTLTFYCLKKAAHVDDEDDVEMMDARIVRCR